MFVKGRTSYLRCLCLFAHSGVQHLLCCVFVLLCFVLCTLGCQFCLDCPSVLSSIYSPCDSIKPCNNNNKWRVSLILITPLVASICYIGEKISINVLLVKLCRIISSGSNIISRSLQSSGSEIALSHISKKYSLFLRPSRDGTVSCDWAWLAGGGRAGGWSGGRPHRFPHNNFSSVYRIFTNLSHMIPLWKGKNPIYFRVIRSKVKVTVTINIIFDNRVVSAR